MRVPSQSNFSPLRPECEEAPASPSQRGKIALARYFSGRLSEISSWRAGASLSIALRLVLDAQLAGENVAWITPRSSSFFPPDAEALGVDLAALAVVRPPREEDMAVAADWLARSGAFGLIVLDLGVLDLGARAISLSALVRLASLAQKHDLAIVCLTEKPADRPSLGSLVSLRGEARRRRRGAGEFECELEVAKDKRRSRPWRHSEVRRGAAGLR
jgi:recombination protein RecA